jgi:hypothetical protein
MKGSKKNIVPSGGLRILIG